MYFSLGKQSVVLGAVGAAATQEIHFFLFKPVKVWEVSFRDK